MTVWNDFNDAEQQQSFDVIPKGTVAWVRMTIKPGGYNDASQGWTGGWATQSEETGAVYLACEFVVLEGPFAKRKLWSNIGLHSPKGPTWSGMGRSFLRALLNSARNVRPEDNSPQAAAARRSEEHHQTGGGTRPARLSAGRAARGRCGGPCGRAGHDARRAGGPDRPPDVGAVRPAHAVLGLRPTGARLWSP